MPTGVLLCVKTSGMILYAKPYFCLLVFNILFVRAKGLLGLPQTIAHEQKMDHVTIHSNRNACVWVALPRMVTPISIANYGMMLVVW